MRRAGGVGFRARGFDEIGELGGGQVGEVVKAHAGVGGGGVARNFPSTSSAPCSGFSTVLTLVREMA